ncbi:PREDICTED: NTPase KAP family P-loop domain-containing protein 1 [Galeopterus variegatus]|uniref:NTPase KAP family P-loop domain-containing protein 1 n=1 Tax=Galeopterus variegatus TaxID=482537 RepID=A0ABM0RW41_GALVR|nr:PREDICTED: NTPase KAP family P-loop domain-containing protein 1 [Galeopterus variegatus]
MHKHYNIHFSKATWTPTEHYFWDPELGHQKGCCQQWCHDPAAPRAHGPCRLSPQSSWQLAYHCHLGGGGSWRWGPQPLISPQQRQPQPPPPSPLRQRLCPVHHGHQKGLPSTIAAPMGTASAPQLPPAPTAAPAMASSSPALPSAASTLLEPSQPTDARPLPAPAACGSFTSYSSDILTEDDVYCSCLAKTLCHVPVPVTVGFYAPFGCRLHMMLDKITGEDVCLLREMRNGTSAPPQCPGDIAVTKTTGVLPSQAVYSVGKHLFVSQRKKIERLVSREKFGSQLGFMCEVKKEVELLTDFLCFLEIYQRRRLRIVLEVTGLDTCYPERVVGVLNAINTLLSDSHAPFIFILVVDPSILAACLESAGNMKGTADNGYLFLNRTVTLPFSVPVMGRRTKLQFLHDAVQSRDDLLYREITRKLRLPAGGGDAWVVLANQWPCRLSWALQCLEDRQQAGGAPEGRARLWDVFRDNSRELHTMTKALQNVLDLDGDPELFARFLGADFPFTVAEAQSLLRCTVNLDHSIRRRMGLLRAVSALKPPSSPKSPARDAPHAANGANNPSGTSPSGRAAGQASDAHYTGDWAHGGKPKSAA